MHIALVDDERIYINEMTEICRRYTLASGKSEQQILNDVWHALISFDDEERLRAWAREKLRLEEEQAANFASIRMPQEYAALSLNAIEKMLPYLRAGYRYDEAVFIANLKAALPQTIYEDETHRHEIEQDIVRLLLDYKRNPYDKYDSKERRIEAYFLPVGDTAYITAILAPSGVSTASLHCEERES